MDAITSFLDLEEFEVVEATRDRGKRYGDSPWFLGSSTGGGTVSALPEDDGRAAHLS